MPWKETVAVEERVKFVTACMEGRESMAQLCRQYGVSRRVGYKWLARYRALGVEGLKDRSRAPRVRANRVSPAMHARVVELRGRHPRWGPKKLKVVLERDDPPPPGHAVPAASTIGAILMREGLSVPRKRSRRAAPPASAPLGHCVGCNRVWCVDFKGWFRTLDGARCDPLTISDAYSRYLLRCQAVPETTARAVRRVLEACFREYGLPEAIRTDNGPPFASSGAAGLSRLGVWWVRLGIAHERIEPGHPEQNGRHERMHLTLKQETTTPAAEGDLRLQQRRFDRFRREFNGDRPHEALGMDTPGRIYAPSSRSYPERLAELEYPAGHQLRVVGDRGEFRWRGHKVPLTYALEGQTIGLEAVTERYWRAWFGPVEVGIFDEAEHRMLRPTERRRRGM